MEVSGLIVSLWVIGLIIAILLITSRWRIFTKANQPGWASIVPIYNALIFLRIIGKPWWWILLFCIPIVNIVFLVWAANLLSKSFGKGEGFTLGLIFIPFVFELILAFGELEYLGPAGR